MCDSNLVAVEVFKENPHSQTKGSRSFQGMRVERLV